MKVLITNFHPRNGGGHVTYVLNLIKGLRGQHELTVATPRTSRLYRYAQAVEGVRVVDMHFSMRLSSWWQEPRALGKLIREGKYDVVHVNGTADHKQAMLATLGWRKRPKIVLTKHNDHPVTSFGHRLRAELATDHVIAVSEYVAGLLRKSAYRKCPITVVRHGVDTDYFKPAGVEEKAAMRLRFCGEGWADKVVFGSSAGTDTAKGWLDLVEGISLLPAGLREKFGVLVAGDPPKHEQINRVDLLKMAKQVVYPGLMDDVRVALAACDIGFVLSYREALSFACREMMAMGMPVLATDVGGLPENICETHDGWIVPARDPRAIAAVLTGLVQRQTQVSEFGLHARTKSLNEFGLLPFTQATMRVYSSVLSF